MLYYIHWRKLRTKKVFFVVVRLEKIFPPKYEENKLELFSYSNVEGTRINNFPIVFFRFQSCLSFSHFLNSLWKNKYTFSLENICFRISIFYFALQSLKPLTKFIDQWKKFFNLEQQYFRNQNFPADIRQLSDTVFWLFFGCKTLLI
jgi:hypothetical protein